MENLHAPQSRAAKPDNALHAWLKSKIEVKTKRHLWTPRDTISFVPRLLATIYGDGKALFAVSTMNNRPAFWVVRCDSSWDVEGGPDFAEFTDQILDDLEAEFGSGRCSYAGANLYLPKNERGCDCEECADRRRAKWPAVDAEGGCSWWRMEWPEGRPA